MDRKRIKRMIEPPLSPEQQSAQKHLPVWVIFTAGVVLLGFLIFLALGIHFSQPQPLVLGNQVNHLNVTLFDGSSVSLSSLKGKTVLINFWASWCTTCIDEAAILEEGWQKVSPDKKIVFIGIDYADTEPAAKAFLKKYAVDYSNGPDLRSTLSQEFRITGVPETYLINGSGTLVGIKIGPFSSLDELMIFLNQKSSN
jgi:cytochrome c biogenesis protein CcmG, thiol:disulfide interchange protein DsbE